jgi:hypothetical protein
MKAANQSSHQDLPPSEICRHGSSWSQRWTPTLIAVLLILPLLVSAVTLINSRYVPVGDQAAMLYRIQQVGSSETPLIGVYSTHGWAHPGPILFYLFAVPYRLFGSRPIIVFVTAALLNAGCVLLVCYLAWRRRHLIGIAVFAAVVATLLNGLRPDTLIQIWNPYVPLLLYVAFLLTLWSLAEADRKLLPLTVILGSFLVQMHVSYIPLVVAGVVCAYLSTRLQVRPGQSAAVRPSTWPYWVAFVAFIVLWLLPFLDMIIGEHNLLRIARYFMHSHSVTGTTTGLGLLSGHLGLNAPWAGGSERVLFASVQPGGLSALIVLAALLSTAIALQIRRGLAGAALPIVAVGQLIAGALAAARIEAPVFSYLVVWMLPLAAFCWAAVFISIINIAGAKTTARGKTNARMVVVSVAILVAGVQTIRTTSVAGKPPLPQQQYARAVTSVLRQLMSQINGSKTIRVEGAGDYLNEPWVGVLYGISQHNDRFLTSDGAQGLKWGKAHVWQNQSAVETLTVAVTITETYQDSVAKCDSTPQQNRVASYDLLTPRERLKLRSLLTDNYNRQGHLPPPVEARLRSLNQKVFRMVVFQGPQPCGL